MKLRDYVRGLCARQRTGGGFCCGSLSGSDIGLGTIAIMAKTYNCDMAIMMIVRR